MSHKPTTVWDEVQLTGSSFLLIKGPVIHPRYLRFTLIVVIQLVYNFFFFFLTNVHLQISKLVNEVYHMFNRHQYPFVALNISVASGEKYRKLIL